MDYQIREIRESEYPILSDFLYEAIFIPEGMNKPPKSILEQPELQLLKDKGYKQASLSVQKANYAVAMYRKAGFEVVDENEEEYIMVCPL